MDSQDSEMKEKVVPVDNQLWVDKYTSSRFFDLLTEEAVNRNVLTWLKSWDEVVFPEKSKVSLKLPESVLL
jgi:chromosome transmission fidelity protein 18